MNTQPDLLTTPEIYAKQFPKFSRPKIIGCTGLENLKYAKNVCNKKVKLNLNLLVEKAQKKPPDYDVKLNDLIKFLYHNEKKLALGLSNKLNTSNFFCFRGLMTCVACTPYENKEPWKIVAILFKGNIFLCARDTEEKKLDKRCMSDWHKLCTSWGFKFEQYMLSDKPHLEPNPNVPVNEMEEFSCFFTTNLHDHKIIYGAEMDGIRCDTEEFTEAPESVDEVLDYLKNKEFIELKTKRHFETDRHMALFRRFNTKKWWCQSFLVGVNTILCGFRNDNGIVEELQTFNVRDLPKMSKQYWDPNVCFNFLDTFFMFVKRSLNREIKRKYGDKALDNLQSVPLTSLLFEFNAYSHQVTVCTDYSHDDDPILPDWFLSHFGKYHE